MSITKFGQCILSLNIAYITYIYEGTAISSVTRDISFQLHERFLCMIHYWKDQFLADTLMYHINQWHYYTWSKFGHNDVILITLKTCILYVLKLRLWCIQIIWYRFSASICQHLYLPNIMWKMKTKWCHSVLFQEEIEIHMT